MHARPVLTGSEPAGENLCKPRPLRAGAGTPGPPCCARKPRLRSNRNCYLVGALPLRNANLHVGISTTSAVLAEPVETCPRLPGTRWVFGEPACCSFAM